MKHILLVFSLFIFGMAAQAQAARPTLKIFPNPAAEYIAVEDHNDALMHIVVYNVIGRKVKEFDYTKGDRYFIGDLPKGYYLIQFLDRNQRPVAQAQKIEKR